MTAPQHRACVQLLQSRGLSQRQACRLVRLSRSTARYQSRREEAAEKELVERMRTLSQKHPRFGYRRVQALLCRAGERVNHKRVYRLWRREGLAVARSVKKKRATGPKQERLVEATGPDAVWTVDFLEDRTVTGQKLRVLTLTDEFTRESLGIEIGVRMPASAVAAVLARVIGERGRAPAYLRSDNGPEFIALVLRGFLQRRGVRTAYIEPGSPWQNGFAESFHSRFRDEFLSREVFLSVVDAQVRSEIWRRWYNEERPHSSLGYQTPCEFATRWRAGQTEKAGANKHFGT